MIPRRRASCLLASAVLAGGLVVAGAATGSATPGSTQASSAWTAGGLIASGPVGSQALGAGAPDVGGSGFAQVGACTFYATSASAGGYCGAGYGGASPPTLQAWLAGRPFIPCRYLEVPTGMVINGGAAPGGHWMLKACFANWDPQEPWGGRDLIVEIYGEWVRDGRDISIPGYMREFWAHAAQENFYPVPRISVGPTQPALVDTYTFFWTTWVKAQDSGQPAEENYRIPYNTLTQGTVYLHMRVHDVVIHPGITAMDPVHCGLAAQEFDSSAPDAIPSSQGGSQRSDCWLMYTHSTAFNADTQTVQIRAEAYWHVTVETPDGQVLRDLGDFHYAAFQRLAVAEVQTLVDW